MDAALEEAKLAVAFDSKSDFENAILHYKKCCDLMKPFPDVSWKRKEYLERIKVLDDILLKKKLEDLKKFEKNLDEQDDVFGRLKKIGYESVVSKEKHLDFGEEDLSEETQVKQILEHAQNFAAMEDSEDEAIAGEKEKDARAEKNNSTSTSSSSSEYSDEKLEALRVKEKAKMEKWKLKNVKKSKKKF